MNEPAMHASLRKHGVDVHMTTPDTMRVKLITASEAAVMQAKADQAEDGRMEWCVHRSPNDFPDKFVARPWMIPHKRDRRNQSALVGAFLIADTLNDLRLMLPHWMKRIIDPQDITDPSLIEVWRSAPDSDANADGVSTGGASTDGAHRALALKKG